VARRSAGVAPEPMLVLQPASSVLEAAIDAMAVIVFLRSMLVPLGYL
jgi:hypothetical protein